MSTIFQTLKIAAKEPQTPSVKILKEWRKNLLRQNQKIYSTHLYNESITSHNNVSHIEPQYSSQPESLTGYQILNRFFDISFEKYDNLVAFGEDVGKIGGVNQSMAGLQQKYGEERIFDTGIREATIIGQAIGLSLRGFKPIAEIQYLDYLLYGLQIIWHTGSPIGTILHSFRGIHVCVPRNMVQAAGMYNTLLQCNDPALVIERLNAYRLKENLPTNLGEYTVPLGVPDVILEGTDVTVVSYGSTLPIVVEAANELAQSGISVEVIDIQTLIPFDVKKYIQKSIKKTNRLIVVDEDVPGGASAYILQQLLNEQNTYYYLDASPITISAKAHRPPFGSDGDYFSKPNKEQIYEEIYNVLHESNPKNFPKFY